jgi:hypothetical protein
MGERFSILLDILKGIECLEDLGVDGRLMLKRLNKRVTRVRCRVMWVSMGFSGGCCFYCNELGVQDSEGLLD